MLTDVALFYCKSQDLSLQDHSVMVSDQGGGGGGKQLPIHSLKWNPNDVLTTAKQSSRQ